MPIGFDKLDSDLKQATSSNLVYQTRQLDQVQGNWIFWRTTPMPSLGLENISISNAQILEVEVGSNNSTYKD